MHTFYCPGISTGDTEYTLDEEESYHCSKVLRIKKGESILLTNGKGKLFEATLVLPDPRKSRLAINNICEGQDKRNFYLHIAIAPTKQTDRMEWFLEKATELGIDEITPLRCEHSERTVLKTERLKKILVSAMKQSGRSYLPQLNEMVSFSEFITRDIKGEKYIAHCGKSEKEKPLLKNLYKPGENTLIMIGPEGDFSEKEVELALKNKIAEISLGTARLRTETAGVFTCCIINTLN